MQVRLLGPVDITVDGTPRPVPGLRRKAVLAVLALQAGKVVDAERLIDVVWTDRAVGTSRNTVQSHVSYLRRALGNRSAIVARPPGYLLQIPGDASDAAAAARLIQAGRQATDPARGVESLRAALAMWRGDPLQDVTEVPWLAEQSRRLVALERDAQRALVDARLALGEHVQLLPVLRRLADQDPFDEQVQAQLALALYRSGRQADALAALREVRQRLATELGIDPGTSLRELEAAVLRQDPALTPPAPQRSVPRPRRSGPALVGRAGELRTLLGHRDRTGAGRASVVAVSGDPGMGKTRLLSEFAEQNAGTVLWGRAAEFEQDLPFAILTDALADHLVELGPDRLAALPDADLGLLREILPMVPGPDTADTARRTLGAERFRLHRAVRLLLETLARPAGLVLILDDLHWADHGSVELLDYLLRHPPRGPVQVAVAYRPRQLAGRLRRGLGRAVQDGLADLIELGPLSPAEAAALLPAHLDDEGRRRLYAAAGGNPFYLQALARADLTGGNAPGDTPPDPHEAMPAAVRDALAAEFEPLTDRERTVVHAAAVAAHLVDPVLVARVADLSLDEVRGALHTAVERDLLRPIPGTDRFQFRHPLVRHVVYDDAGPGWRVSAHARTATALAERGAPLAERAHHIDRSAQPGDLAAVGVLRQAATETLHSSPAAAAQWLGTALRLVPGDDGALLRLDLLGLQAQSLVISGQLTAGRAALHELLHLLPDEVTTMRAQLVSACVGVERMLGRHSEAEALLQAELARLPDSGDPAAATLLVALAAGHLHPGRVGGQDWAGQALTAARRVGDRCLVADALVKCVLNDQIDGTWDSATADRLNEAAALVDAMPDGELIQLLHTAVWLATAESAYERLHDATRHCVRALELTRSTGQMYLAPGIHLLQGGLHLMRGELAASARSLEDARDAAALAGGDSFMGLVLSRQSAAATLAGNFPLAFRLAGDAAALTGTQADLFSATAVEVLAFAYLHAGEPAACTELLAGGTERFGFTPAARGIRHEMLAMAAAAQGQPAAAARWADRADAEVAVWPTPRRLGLATLARAHALSLTDPGAAATHAAAAARTFLSAHDLLLAGRSHLHASTALAAAGDTAVARQALVRAGELFEVCGSPLFLARVRDEERRQGGRVTPSLRPAGR